MLVLSRHQGEEITIHVPNGYVIRVLVTQLLANRVKLGFDAPLNVKVIRSELEDDACSE